MVQITKAQFHRYVKVQDSGVTNMFDIPVVTALAGLSKAEVKNIQKNYEKLEKNFGRPDAC